MRFTYKYLGYEYKLRGIKESNKMEERMEKKRRKRIEKIERE